MYLREGFPGQRLHVLPTPLVAEALQRPPTGRLLITDAGYFPHAARHGRVRRAGAGQAIVIICVDGGGWCELAGVRHSVQGGQVLIIPPDVPHRYYADADDPWSIWWCHVTGDDLAELLGAVGLGTDDPVGPLLDPHSAAAMIAEICDWLDRDETFASLTAAAGVGWNLLARLAAERERRDAGSHRPLQLVHDHLRQRLSDPVSVPALAELAGYSTSHFAARFRQATGYPVLEYVKRLRMARARQLLITSDASVAEIAAAVGYPDPYYFSRQFRTVTGTSPSEFRRSHVP